MEEYIYSEEKYISTNELNNCDSILSKYEFMPEEIQDNDEFDTVIEYFIELTEKFPLYLPSYEYILRMISTLQEDENLNKLKTVVENSWHEASNKVAEKDKIFDKTVEWGWMENRPLIRGLYNYGNKLWKEGKMDEAHELFSKILKSNEHDNIGARYSVKATAEGMSYDEFEKRFTESDDEGT